MNESKRVLIIREWIISGLLSVLIYMRVEEERLDGSTNKKQGIYYFHWDSITRMVDIQLQKQIIFIINWQFVQTLLSIF